MDEEEIRDDLNLISMQVILHAGNARDIVMEVLDGLATKNPDFALLGNKLEKARAEITIAHKNQTDMLQREANGDFIPYSVLFGHAQDTLMTIQSELIMAEKLVPAFRELKEG
ncbi:PTS lactose/cellobiose transporter subunit IIA [uncultured Lacticaseibacillus sp.]|uniref:PTS lactose/cellobiose transporter subunit IIA n=1 Tax=uncultured Lacticaseibacillus sp. TaxID=2775882 RepID=UPI00259783A6|nr:PTS lactose/cellobiose transporter subunit IIA [uncultured Lacticaseibacillus sp.]